MWGYDGPSTLWYDPSYNETPCAAADASCLRIAPKFWIALIPKVFACCIWISWLRNNFWRACIPPSEIETFLWRLELYSCRNEDRSIPEWCAFSIQHTNSSASPSPRFKPWPFKENKAFCGFADREIHVQKIKQRDNINFCTPLTSHWMNSVSRVTNKGNTPFDEGCRIIARKWKRKFWWSDIWYFRWHSKWRSRMLWCHCKPIMNSV